MTMGLVERIVRGGPNKSRATRFHDENNVFMGWSELRHLPNALFTTARSRWFRSLPDVPHWPYPAIARIASVLPRDAVVLEYGTGSSTLWLAKRAAKVYGIEGSPEWFSVIRELAAKRHFDNVTLFLRDSTRYPDRGARSDVFNDEFASLEGIADRSFDFVVVDGAARWRCVERALPTVRSGGYLYLDNSDADKDWIHYTTSGLRKEAQRLLEDAVAAGIGSLERFRGFAPATPHAEEGMLFHKN